MGILDNALNQIQAHQSSLGALHQRLEFSMSSNLLLSESLSEARFRAIDADTALEITELTRQQILQQAQVAVLAQANLQMNLVLNLLKGLE